MLELFSQPQISDHHTLRYSSQPQIPGHYTLRQLLHPQILDRRTTGQPPATPDSLPPTMLIGIPMRLTTTEGAYQFEIGSSWFRRRTPLDNTPERYG